MKATIDIGSNSILLLIGEYRDGKYNIIENEARITGLGKGIDKTKTFCEESMQLSFDVLKEYSAIARKHGIESSEIIATATEASRVVTNSSSFYQKIKSELGIYVSIICGKGEAYYTALGVSSGMTTIPSHTVVMDIGGASTEFISLVNGSLQSSVSLPLGCVRATEWSEHGEFQSRFEQITERFELSDYSSEKLVCVAGSMTSLAAVFLDLSAYKDEDVHGLSVSIDDYIKFCDRLNGLSPDELKDLYPYLGKRAYVLHAGAEIALRLARKLGVKTIEVSTYGLRFGTLSAGAIGDEFLAK